MIYPEDIISVVCKEYAVSRKEISFPKNNIYARTLSVILLRKFTTLTYRNLANLFKVDYTTVIYMESKVDDYKIKNAEFLRLYVKISQHFDNQEEEVLKVETKENISIANCHYGPWRDNSRQIAIHNFVQNRKI